MAEADMFNAARRPLPISDQLSIYWWRLVIYATRRLNRLKLRVQPVASPLVPFLWVPLLALVLGMLIGWVIALA
jgi:hypothetical protein